MTRTSKDVDEALRLIENIRSAGSLGDDSYYKCLVSLGFEYLVSESVDAGLRLISRVPADYYRDVQLRQMEEDEMYRILVINLAHRLIQLGMVAGTDTFFSPTQAPGKA